MALNQSTSNVISSAPAAPGGATGQTVSQDQKEKKKKESILDLRKYLDKVIRVKFSGGREVSGILKGFDQLLNLVLDNTVEYLRGKAIVCTSNC